jgi:hypothetical protein
VLVCLCFCVFFFQCVNSVYAYILWPKHLVVRLTLFLLLIGHLLDMPACKGYERIFGTVTQVGGFPYSYPYIYMQIAIYGYAGPDNSLSARIPIYNKNAY